MRKKIKTIGNILLFLIFAPFVNAKKAPSVIEVLLEKEEDAQRAELKKRYEAIRLLSLAKKNIINGSPTKAQYILEMSDNKKSKFFKIEKRYLAITYFLNEKYEESLKILQEPYFNISGYYKEICLLKVINMAMLKDPNLSKESRSCESVLDRYSRTELYWYTTIINIILKNNRAVKGSLLSDLQYILHSDELTKLWIKLALYIKREDMVIANTAIIPQARFQNKEIRELLGLLYYRKGNNELAQNFIEDLKGPNSDNIRGNIYLQQKKYEIAYGHFKLALNKKYNSLNSLERIIPISWLIEKWEDGEKHLYSYISNDVDPIKKEILKTAFIIKQKKYEKADDNLQYLLQKKNLQRNLNVLQMKTYTSLILDTPNELYESSVKACQLSDGLACWLRLQQLTWENISKTIKRPAPTIAKKITIEDLKTQKDSTTPLDEKIYINQKDIDELDEKDIFQTFQGVF